ncbi:NAD-dependent epimerase/dehydratase family protein [Paracraurococcus ruber]|nr:NAD(P)-dependent oxidoreductase [Paracraurococcus ruber]
MAASGAVLVTGAAGLIGRRAAERLLASGRPVLATDRIAPPGLPFEVVPAELTDTARLAALVARGVAAILHCGGISGQMLAKDHPAGIFAANAAGTVTLLELARIFRVPRFVFCSSVHAYGDTPAGMDPVTEAAPLLARDAYGASKAAAEAALRAYAAEHGVAACALRLGWVYGPRRTTPSLTARMVRDAARGMPETAVDHDGSFPVPLLHVEDAVSALLAALDAPDIAGLACNIVGGPSLPVTGIAARITALRPGWRARFTPGHRLAEYRQGDFSIAAARAALGWTPQVTPEAGLAAYLDWLSREPA